MAVDARRGDGVAVRARPRVSAFGVLGDLIGVAGGAVDRLRRRLVRVRLDVDVAVGTTDRLAVDRRLELLLIDGDAMIQAADAADIAIFAEGDLRE